MRVRSKFSNAMTDATEQSDDLDVGAVGQQLPNEIARRTEFLERPFQLDALEFQHPRLGLAQTGHPVLEIASVLLDGLDVTVEVIVDLADHFGPSDLNPLGRPSHVVQVSPHRFRLWKNSLKQIPQFGHLFRSDFGHRTALVLHVSTAGSDARAATRHAATLAEQSELFHRMDGTYRTARVSSARPSCVDAPARVHFREPIQWSRVVSVGDALPLVRLRTEAAQWDRTFEAPGDGFHVAEAQIARLPDVVLLGFQGHLDDLILQDVVERQVRSTIGRNLDDVITLGTKNGPDGGNVVAAAAVQRIGRTGVALVAFVTVGHGRILEAAETVDLWLLLGGRRAIAFGRSTVNGACHVLFKSLDAFGAEGVQALKQSWFDVELAAHAARQSGHFRNGVRIVTGHHHHHSQP